jgi:rhombotail lipoprotein|uniref:rhombotarget lipoprotein n=1 Tax=Cephaloticoccus sp. TaxID=1985742 RepID=UPI00404B335E
MKPSKRVVLGLALAIGGSFLVSGCAMLFDSPEKADRSSSVVNFLYPGQVNPLPPRDIPVLRLPLRVGIAFVPSYQTGSGGFSEQQKAVLMERVAREFRSKEYIQTIEIIPATYLRPNGGFTNLDQVSSLLNVDVIALLAYDQVQFTNINMLSLVYWTLEGRYLFQGKKNDTHTLMEAAVYDIRSQHLLFRAPGASQVEGKSTVLDLLHTDMRAESSEGFDRATDALIINLKLQLEDFRDRIRKSPETVKIEHKPGYTGGGSIEGWFAWVIALLAMGRWARARWFEAKPCV